MDVNKQLQQSVNGKFLTDPYRKYRFNPLMSNEFKYYIYDIELEG